MVGTHLVNGLRDRTVRRTRDGVVAAIRGTLRAGKTTLWVARKFCFYLLPPVVYDVLKASARGLAPRVLRRDGRVRLRAAWTKRFRHESPALAPAPVPALAAAPAADPWANDPPAEPAAWGVYKLYRETYLLPEDTPGQLRAKADRYRELAAGTHADRVRLMREIARLELAGGDAVKACLYKIRAMRLLGRDEYDDLPWVRDTLERAGYAPEAEATWAMYGRHGDRDALCTRLIQSARETFRTPPPLPADYTIFDDRRGNCDPRVTVIMTVYNAAAKLPAFLEALQLQTLNRAGRMELVIVDSNSPADEHAALKGTVLRYPIPTLFVRTAGRETIQTAWNRAIGLARAPYLSLLGADEGIAPETLSVLADELDADPAADWAQGDILVTEVDRHGSQVADIMPYDRAGFTKDIVYLETCYLGPVGAIHRKDMHARAGYFDGSYRGAGDTEFKNRVLPGIRVKCVPKMLGLYLNYPEERTTASPRAELEDLRAWYLHRTPAGMRLAFAGRPVADLEALLVQSLRYRKSYCRHHSTDFELADTLARVLRERDPASPVLALAPGITRALAAVRAVDHLTSVRPGYWSKALADARAALAAVAAEHERTGLVKDPQYRITNDNRYEQHVHLW